MRRMKHWSSLMRFSWLSWNGWARQNESRHDSGSESRAATISQQPGHAWNVERFVAPTTFMAEITNRDRMPRRDTIARATGVATLLLSLAGNSLAQASRTLTIRSAGRDSVLTVAQLASIPRRDLRVAGEHSTDPATVSVLTLWAPIQKAGEPSASASGRERGAAYVRLKGADGQSAMFGLVEIDPSFSKRTVLVADRRNGQPLDAAEGPWRAFVPDDIRHARWIRGLVPG